MFLLISNCGSWLLGGFLFDDRHFIEIDWAFPVYPLSARITRFSILECLSNSFSISTISSLKIRKSWYEPAKSEWIKRHSPYRFVIICDFKQYDLCFPLKNSFLSSKFPDGIWILFIVESTISFASGYCGTLIRSSVLISSINLLVNTEWQSFITVLNVLFKVLRLTPNWINMTSKVAYLLTKWRIEGESP